MRQWLALAMLLLLFTAACSGKTGKESQKPETRKQAGEGAAPVQPKREITLTREAPAARPQTLPPVGQEQSLLALPSAEVTPEDFEIGSLQDLLEGSKEQRDMAAAAETLLRGLQSGKVEAESLTPEIRDELGRSLSYYLDQNIFPTAHRLGTFNFEKNNDAEPSGWLRLRLFSSSGASTGELYLSLLSGRWYVSDIQVSFEQLNQTYARRQEQYIPSAYGWRIE